MIIRGIIGVENFLIQEIGGDRLDGELTVVNSGEN